MSFDPRLAAAVAAGRSVAIASRLLRRGGGTTLPGDIARVVDPGVLRKLGRGLAQGTILVTGTNGKTTTTGMIAAALAGSGRRVVTNLSGANLIHGLTAAAIGDSSWLGLPRAEIAVLEVDELWFERAVVELQPRVVVVLNFLRDQLDRSGELDTTAIRVGAGLRRLPQGAAIVANVDDPHVLAQVEGLPGVVGIGIDADELLLPGLPHAADARQCPRCDAELEFSRVVLAHCGTYRCPNGDFARPAPAFAATRLQAPSLDHLRIDIEDTTLEVAVGGVYNAYNTVAAYATLRTAGLDRAAAVSSLSSFRPRFGRQEALPLHGRTLRFLLAKNPSGFDEVLRTADDLGECRAYLIAINDRIADGRDVSWLWDVDFERLARSRREPHVVASGRRAHDLAVRLKYAGLPLDRLTVEPDAAAALRAVAALDAGGREVAVLPTYTAMLELREVAQRAGAVDPFWSTTATSRSNLPAAVDAVERSGSGTPR